MFIEFVYACALVNWGANIEGCAVLTTMLYLQIIIIFQCTQGLCPLWVVTLSNHCPSVPFVHIGIFSFHALLQPCAHFFPSGPLTKSSTCSHHPAWPIIPPLMMSRLFPLLLGHSPSVFLPTTLYHGIFCRLLDQFNG